MALSLTWADYSSSVLNWFLYLISPVVLLRNLFYLDSESPDYASRYIFKGMVCFVASHYIAFFYSLRRNTWIQFDDSTVLVIDDWNEVLGKMLVGKMIPVLMFYELDSVLDRFKRQHQLEYLENDFINYLLDPTIFFESFTDILTLDLAGLIWKSDVLKENDGKKCFLF